MIFCWIVDNYDVFFNFDNFKVGFWVFFGIYLYYNENIKIL